MKKILQWLRTVPHLFGKVMVIACLLGGAASIAVAFRILSRTDNDPAMVLAAALAFFGTELGMMFGRDALKGKSDKKTESEESV